VYIPVAAASGLEFVQFDFLVLLGCKKGFEMSLRWPRHVVFEEIYIRLEVSIARGWLWLFKYMKAEARHAGNSYRR